MSVGVGVAVLVGVGLGARTVRVAEAGPPSGVPVPVTRDVMLTCGPVAVPLTRTTIGVHRAALADLADLCRTGSMSRRCYIGSLATIATPIDTL